jgi:hypothetical protein
MRVLQVEQQYTGGERRMRKRTHQETLHQRGRVAKLSEGELHVVGGWVLAEDAAYGIALCNDLDDTPLSHIVSVDVCKFSSYGLLIRTYSPQGTIN